MATVRTAKPAVVDIDPVNGRAPRLVRAISAYEFLSQLKAVAKAEHQRFYMGDWIRTNDNPVRIGGYSSGTVLQPACGTAACIGGWTAVMARAESVNVGRIQSRIVVSEEAGRLLGLTPRQRHHLFSETVLGKDGVSLTPGTPEYVDAVVRRISNFQANHGPQLHKKMVKPGSLRIG